MKTTHPMIERFLADLEVSAAGLSVDDRFELISDIRGHLDEALPPDATDEQVSAVLTSLGSPADIASAAGIANWPPPSVASAPQPFVKPEPRIDTKSMFGLLGMGIGWLILPIIGPIIGAVLIATSDRWSRTRKTIGIVAMLPLALLPIAGASLTIVMRSDSVATVESGPIERIETATPAFDASSTPEEIEAAKQEYMDTEPQMGADGSSNKGGRLSVVLIALFLVIAAHFGGLVMLATSARLPSATNRPNVS